MSKQGKPYLTWEDIADLLPGGSLDVLAHAASHESGGSDVIDALTLSNLGLRILDTGADHYLTIKPNENLSGSRILNIITGDAARTITLQGNPTLADWFDQAVKQASSPTFNSVYIADSACRFYKSGSRIYVRSESVDRVADFTSYGMYLPRLGQSYNLYLGGSLKVGHTESGKIDVVGYIAPSTGLKLGAFYLNSLIANNKVPDTYKWQGCEPAGLTVGHVVKALTATTLGFQANNLGGLSDVTLGSLEEGETIAYDQATSKWIDAWGVEYDNPRLVYKMYTDFFSKGAAANDPWVGAQFGGTCAATSGTQDHPGIARFTAMSADTGYRFMTATNCIKIGGAEHSEFVFKTGSVLTNVRVRMGYQDSLDDTTPTDSVHLKITGAGIAGNTRNNGSGSTTSSYTLSTSTWYRAKIAVNSNATLVTFILYSAAGTQLWSQTLSTNIPTGRTTGHGIVMWVSTAATKTFDLDMMIATRAGYITR